MDYLGPHTALTVPISGERGFAGLSLPLDALKQLAAAHDAKLNDIVLALCSGALRRWLAQHGGIPKKPLVAAMPISLRAAGNTDFTTQATMMLVNLHTDRADPVRRLHAIRDAADAAKALAGRAKGGSCRRTSLRLPCPGCCTGWPRCTAARTWPARFRRSPTWWSPTCPGHRCRSTRPVRGCAPTGRCRSPSMAWG